MDVTHFLIAIFGFSMLMRAVHGDNASKDVCDQWANIARKVSGSGKFHNCTTRAQECTAVDCSGATTFSRRMLPTILPSDIDIRYCFGMQINSCNVPLSMDFYLQIPSRSISKNIRVFDDEVYPLKELNFSLGSYGTAYPVFNFLFERNTNSAVNLSVSAQVNVQTMLGEIPFTDYRIVLINDQIVPVKPCKNTVQDSSKMPPKNFAPEKCQLMPYIPLVTAAPAASVKPSGTLNMTCDLEHAHCGQREVCHFDLKPPRCTCNFESQLNAKGDTCLSSSRLNLSCGQDDDCGINEECRVGSSNTSTCQCREHNNYDAWRGICTVSHPGDTTAAVEGHPMNNQSHITNSDNSGPVTVKTSSSHGEHNIPIFVGGGLAAAVIIGLVIGGVICYKRRRHQPLSINDRESSAPLIGSDDSDNLIM